MKAKRESRIIGIDDGPFDKRKDREVLIVGTVFRGGQYLDGLLSTTVIVDGDDATERIAAMVNRCKWKGQVRAIMLAGVAVAGFNVIDCTALREKTGIPVLVVMRRMPEQDRMARALLKLSMRRKAAIVLRLGEPAKVDHLFVQRAGITVRDTLQLLKITCTHGKLPEPVRIAHIIASGLATGESHGDA